MSERTNSPATPGDGSPSPAHDVDEEDWERRVADWTAGRRGVSPAEPSEPAPPPASYQPDPSVYEPAEAVAEQPRPSRWAKRLPSAPRRSRRPAEDGESAAGTVQLDALRGVATWTPDAAAREAAMVVPSDAGPSDAAPTDAAPTDAGPTVSDEAVSDETERNGRRLGRGGANVGSVARRLRGRLARDDDDDDGPFLPPETDVPPDATFPSRWGTSETAAPTPAPPPARPRPRPAPGVAGTGQEAADRPRPRPRPRPAGTTAPAAPASVPRPAAARAAESRPTAARPAVPRPAVSRPAVPAAAATPATDATAKEQDAPAEATPHRSFRERLRSTKLARRLTKLVILVVVVVAAALLLRTYVVAPYYIPSQSMEPTLYGCPGCSNDDHVLVDKLSYRFHQPHAGDIVVFDKPAKLAEDDPVLIKRVIAVGGDLLVLKHGDVYINGQRLSEPYINKSCGPNPSTPLTNQSRWVIPDDDVFVMGDNRCDSTDSRYFGPIPVSSIVGRAFVIVWPLKRFSFL